jgi:hypothetical protein
MKTGFVRHITLCIFSFINPGVKHINPTGLQAYNGIWKCIWHQPHLMYSCMSSKWHHIWMIYLSICGPTITDLKLHDVVHKIYVDLFLKERDPPLRNLTCHSFSLPF